MRLLFCACRLYHHIDSDALDALTAACCVQGYEVTVVPDLCRLAAQRDQKLAESYDWIIACHPRAIRAMFPDFPANSFYNLRTDSAAELAESLGVRLGDKMSEFDEIEELPDQETWIPWFPVIDMERCVNCGKCLDFCMFGVYARDSSGQVQVTSPANCKTDCPACARMCPRQAIIFPKAKEEPINGAEPTTAARPAANDAGGLLARLRSRNAAKPSAPPLFKDDPP
ncbi:MAG TPA: hypothetical protein PLH67_02320 [Lentisphaeria bacterium]|nr:hypothetical protein [Lentisphaeria bacterium]